jgi:hypothetical protein
MALAIVQDCEKCEDSRAKASAQKIKETFEEEQRQQRASAQKAQLKAAEQNRESSRALIREREAEAGKEVKEREKRERTPPLPSSDEETDSRPRRSSSPADAKWEKKRGRAHCCGCGKGDIGGEKRHVHFCEVCGTPYHEPCTPWEKLVVAVTAPLRPTSSAAVAAAMAATAKVAVAAMRAVLLTPRRSSGKTGKLVSKSKIINSGNHYHLILMRILRLYTLP